jgi:uncharacterized sporulation protein YeaH/YhbH (DUF444 family)
MDKNKRMVGALTYFTQQQFGGTAIFTINDTSHRVLEKGFDSSNLGRWTWTK